jgi:hypothetical protein
MEAANNYGPAAYDPDAYMEYLRGAGIATSGYSKYLSAERPKNPNWWHQLENAFSDANGNVLPEVQGRIYDNLHKNASLATLAQSNGLKWAKKGLGALWHTGMYALPAYGIYSALTADKPYDEELVRQEGYAGAQAGIQKRLSTLSPFERQMLRLDPSLATSGLESAIPGATAQWEKNTGQKYSPGFLGGVLEAWNKRGTPSFYSTDATGRSVYL